MSINKNTIRKIIHIDMDCFYAAIEIRDNPSLLNKPVAVGGLFNERGVIATCNYLARKYGVHSAMATKTALRYCKNLIVLPVNMAKYKEIAKNIRKILLQFTDLVEPLSLDEAYLDVSNVTHFKGSATLIAEEIRKQIFSQEQLTASAGVAPNKFLAKIASGLKKPNGIFIISPDKVNHFIKTLPVKALPGVGKVTQQKLVELNLHHCADLEKISLEKLVQHFGKFGKQLFLHAQGIDERKVEPNRIRKSLSVEETFVEDINNFNECQNKITLLYTKLVTRIKAQAGELSIKNQFIKIKFSDFTIKTSMTIINDLSLPIYQQLFYNIYEWQNNKKPIRLLGLGVRFDEKQKSMCFQYNLF